MAGSQAADQAAARSWAAEVPPEPREGGQATERLGREGWRGKGGWWAAVGGEVAASRGVVVEADGGGVEDEEEGRGCELQIRWRTRSRREEDEAVAGEGRPTGGWWIVQV